MQSSASFDVAIVGGSHAGLGLALALVRLAGRDIRVAIIDRVDVSRRAETPIDPRAFAISAGSRNLLAAIGVWPAVTDQAAPVCGIDISDSALSNAVRPVVLSYDNQIDGVQPATFIVPADALRNALLDAAGQTPNIAIIAPATVQGCERLSTGVTVTLQGGTLVHANLLVAADGAKSPLRAAAGIRTVDWSTSQVGLVTTVEHERPHGGRAVQHFLPDGPFAMLPLIGNRTCVTWTENAARGREIAALDATAFSAELERRFGYKLGALQTVGPLALWPLEFHVARTLIARRFALIGDAARSVHPLAGQGLNLGLRDVAALAEAIVDAMRLGLEPADTTALERYELWRRFDSSAAAAAFGALNSVFSNDSMLLRTVRGVGLGLVDRIPALKQLLVMEAAGLTGDVPRLMQAI